jgi:hypothetical protein
MELFWVLYGFKEELEGMIFSFGEKGEILVWFRMKGF